LTKDHRPTDEDEKKRVEDLKGTIVMKKVGGILAVSRAFGDADLKQWVTAEPHIRETEITVEDTHIIFACDGLWGVAEEEKIAKYVKNHESSPAKEMATRLGKIALSKKSTDNITVIVLNLPKQSKPESKRASEVKEEGPEKSASKSVEQV